MNAKEYINNQLHYIQLCGKAGDFKNVRAIVKQTRKDWTAFAGDEYYEEMNEKVQRMLDKAYALATAK